MLIVKPHGRSEAVFDAAGALRRALYLNPDGAGPRDIAGFAAEHPELVIAQWVSAIDRIAAKPRGKGKPSLDRRRLRDALGRAAFELLDREGAFDGDGRREEMERLWKRKVHPYGEGDDARRTGGEKGRLYTRFAGEVEPGDIGGKEAAAIAARIAEHLNEAEYRIHAGCPKRRRGRIAARARSIAGNVSLAAPPSAETPWSDRGLERYKAAGDVAGAIRGAAEAREAGTDGAGTRRVGPEVAARALHAHYAKLFRDEGGAPLPIAGAREREPGLFALHMAVRDAYSRVLKRHRKGREREAGTRRAVSSLLPPDMDALFRLVEAKGSNRDTGALVRLGKMLHYEAATGGADRPAAAIDAWPGPDALDRSHYRTSRGQAEIKRNEAFVRVWRRAVALAARTAAHWADPDGRLGGDILGRAEEATGERFGPAAHEAALPHLFGDRRDGFAAEGGDNAFARSVLRLAIEGWTRLRNASFHFKGREGFARALREGLAGAGEAEAVAAARRLHRRDMGGRRERLVATLRAAHAEHYLDPERSAALLRALAGGARGDTPLPRFRRVLDRAGKAWRRKPFVLRLPAPENRRALETDPGRLCRHIVLKLLYERCFPAWLEARDHGALNAWVDRAVERATREARKINRDDAAVARAAGSIRLGEGEGIGDFVDRLSAATATELRVQRGYDSDADKAREQAKYIDNLRCDAMAMAFEAWLGEAGFDWALEDFGDGPAPEAKTADLDAAAAAAPGREEAPAEDWEVVLYFLVHLVPVDAASRLRHQMRKWTVLEGAPSTEAEAAGRVLDLYLDMHDAKFEGGEGLAGAKALAGLFESPELFRRVCPSQPGDEAGRLVPLRGLREVLRFGGPGPLMPVFEEHPVTAAMVEEVARAEADGEDGSPIARAHAERERLHAKWSKDKSRFARADKAAYAGALGRVERHRHLAAHVRLASHARLHRLAIEVLGRLADYAGLWERDLYFATLGLLRRDGMAPADAFRNRGLRELRDGRIVPALRELRRDEAGPGVLAELERLFGAGFLSAGEDSAGGARARNILVHFEMLRPGAPGST